MTTDHRAAGLEKMARAIFFSQHSIMHDHEQHWKAAEQLLWVDFATAALAAWEAHCKELERANDPV